MLSSNASITNQVFVKFISRVTNRPLSEIVPPERSRADRMADALALLSEILGDPNIASRDPDSPLSFSGLSPELSQSQSDVLTLYGKDQAKAFSPLRPDGRPIRR